MGIRDYTGVYQDTWTKEWVIVETIPDKFLRQRIPHYEWIFCIKGYFKGNTFIDDPNYYRKLKDG